MYTVGKFDGFVVQTVKMLQIIFKIGSLYHIIADLSKDFANNRGRNRGL